MVATGNILQYIMFFLVIMISIEAKVGIGKKSDIRV